MAKEELEIMQKWGRYCSRHGYPYIQPSTSDMDFDGDFVILRNCNGVIARYNTVTGKFTLPKRTERKAEGILYDVALEALIRYHDANPSVYDANGIYAGERIWQQPARDMTRFTCRYVYLNNVNGLVAKYDFRRHCIIC